MRLSGSLTKLLILFVSRSAELITREQIASCLWEEPQSIDVSNGINTAVNRLRAALNDDPAAPIYIETVVGLGYRFIASVDRVTDPAQEVSSRDEMWKVAQQSTPALIKPTSAVASLRIHPEIGSGTLPERDRNPEAAMWGAPAKSENPPQTPSFTLVIPQESSRKHWQRVFVLLIGLMVAGGTALLLQRPRRLLGSAERTPFSKMTFVQTTFNDADNGVTAEAVSRDGHTLAFGDRDGVSLRMLDTGIDRLLSSPKNLRIDSISWYAGDRKLLVSGIQNAGEEYTVWIVSAEAEPPRLLLQDANNAVASPDGTRLAFTRRRGAELWVTGTLGEAPRKLLTGAEGDSFTFLLWVPGGNRLVYQRRRTPAQPARSDVANEAETRQYQWDYEPMDAATGAVLAVEHDIKFGTAYMLPDGRMFFPENRFSEEHASARLLMVRTDLRSGAFLAAPEQAGNLPGDTAVSISASEDGKQVATVLERRSSDVQIADVHFPGPSLDRQRRLIHNAPDNYPHAWTIDGDAVLFESNELGSYSIYKQKTDGTSAQLLARSPGDAVLPQLSPDGKWVLFEDFTKASAYHADAIFRVPLNGGKLEQVPTQGTIDEFQCSISTAGICVLRQTLGLELVYFAFDPILGQGRSLGEQNGSRISSETGLCLQMAP